MPYSASNPPSKTHTLTPSGRRQWVHVFNSALKRGGSEESAHRMAWAAARKAGKRKKKPKMKKKSESKPKTSVKNTPREDYRLPRELTTTDDFYAARDRGSNQKFLGRNYPGTPRSQALLEAFKGFRSDVSNIDGRINNAYIHDFLAPGHIRRMSGDGWAGSSRAAYIESVLQRIRTNDEADFYNAQRHTVPAGMVSSRIPFTDPRFAAAVRASEAGKTTKEPYIEPKYSKKVTDYLTEQAKIPDSLRHAIRKGTRGSPGLYQRLLKYNLVSPSEPGGSGVKHPEPVHVVPPYLPTRMMDEKLNKSRKAMKKKSSKLKKLATLSLVNNVLKNTFHVDVFHPEPRISKEAYRIATIIQVKDCVRSMLKSADDDKQDTDAVSPRIDIAGKNFRHVGLDVTPEMQAAVKDYNSRLAEMLGLQGIGGLSMLGGGAGVLYNLLTKRRNDEGKVESRSFSDYLPWLLLGGAGYTSKGLVSPPDDTRVNEIIAKLRGKSDNREVTPEAGGNPDQDGQA